jgi:hypothetical protein
MRLVAMLWLLAGCQKTHEVALRLGPNDTTVTQGFLCVEDADPSKPLVDRALVGETYTFRLVVDVIDLGGRLPGCRGEELVTTCKGGKCKIVKRSDGTRYCQEVTFSKAELAASDPRPLLLKIHDQLAMDAVTSNAPDRPVLIRAVATHQTCDQLDAPFVDSELIGCAYSCPAQLDAIDGPISLSLDVLDSSCEKEVRGCAKFPL